MVRRPQNGGKDKGSRPGQTSDQESDPDKVKSGGGSENSEKRPVATLDLKAEEKSQDKSLTKSEAKSDDPIKTIISESGLRPDQKEGDEKAGGKSAAETSDKTHSKTARQADQSKGKFSDDDDDQDDASEITPEQIAMMLANQKSSGSFFKMLFAGLIGAVLALGGQQFMPRLVTGNEDGASNLIAQNTELKNQLTALETKINEVSGQASTARLEEQFAELSRKVETSAENDVSERLGSLEQTMKDLSAVASGGEEQIAGVAAIATKVNSLESRVQNEMEAIKTEFSNKLKSDIEQISKAVAEQESLAQIEGVKLKATTLSKKLAELDAQSSKFDDDIAAMRSDVDGIKSSLINRSALDQQLEPLQSSLASIEEKLAVFAKREQQAHEAARRSALAIAFNNLKRTMDRGEGFGSELEAVKKLAGSEIDFSTLSGFVQSGIPTEQALIDAFPKLAIEAISETGQIDDQSGWDKLVTKARTAFRYRRTGDVEGETSEAVLARMEHKFKRGEVENVLKEGEALKGHALRVMTPWLKQLEGRLQVEKAMHTLEEQLLVSLSPR